MEFLAEMAYEEDNVANKNQGAVSPKKDRVFHDEFFLHPSWIGSNFVPLMFLQDPYFSAEGALGLPKAKSWWEHCLGMSGKIKK